MHNKIPCPSCGVLQGITELDDAMWDIYDRIDDGRSRYEPLVFTSDWLQENVHDEEDEAAIMHAMEKDMHHRGLCPTCSRPDLSGVTADMIMSEKDAQDMRDMWAEEAAERRAGC